MHTLSYVNSGENRCNGLEHKASRCLVENDQRKSGNFLEERTFDLLLKEGTNFYIFDNSRTLNLLLEKNKHFD
jgi:hypothetical protein